MADRPEGEEVRGVPHQLPEQQEAAEAISEWMECAPEAALAPEVLIEPTHMRSRQEINNEHVRSYAAMDAWLTMMAFEGLRRTRAREEKKLSTVE